MPLVVFLTKLELTLRLSLAVPSLDLGVAYDHAAAAVDAAVPGVPAELLLSIAYIESRFDPTATSRMEGDVRRTGSYPSLVPPRPLRGSLFCGPLQTYARTWKACLGMRVLATGYGAGASELGRWMRDRRVAGNVTRALLGHGCGNHGLSTGRCNAYPNRVLQFSRRLRSPARITSTARPTM